MKCQILFSGKNKKNIINLSSAENAQRVVKVNNNCLVQYLPCVLRQTCLNKLCSPYQMLLNVASDKGFHINHLCNSSQTHQLVVKWISSIFSSPE